MGLKISGFQFNGLSVPDAYLKISGIRLQKTDAFVDLDIFADKATRDAGGEALRSLTVILNGDRFTESLGAAPCSPPEGLSAPVSVEDIVLTQSYLALQVHPDTQDLLSGSVVE